MSTAEIINISTGPWALIITIMLLIVAGIGGNLKQQVYRCFFFTLLLNLLIFVTEIVIWGLQGYTGSFINALIRMVDYINYVIAALQHIAFAYYLYAYINTRTDASKKFVSIIIGFSTGTILLATIAQFNHMYAQFDEYNFYHKQELFWISQIFPTLSLFTCILFTMQNVKALKVREWASVVFYCAIILACYVLEIMFSELWLAYIGGTIALLIIYINIQVELKQQMKMQEAELAESRITVMLSQIQPHFLYNSLTAISQLCYDNPQAHRALITFSQYLRFNMDTLSQKTLAPFKKELEHVRQYLWLEHLRFGERLQIVYDIAVDTFMLPALTLQPIVENAVRHGVNKKRAGGTVIIRTEETAYSFFIVVSDDGVGFQPQEFERDGQHHMGIANVRSRLAAMCDGRLTIESTIGKGTIVTIELPKGEKE